MINKESLKHATEQSDASLSKIGGKPRHAIVPLSTMQREHPAAYEALIKTGEYECQRFSAALIEEGVSLHFHEYKPKAAWQTVSESFGLK